MRCAAVVVPALLALFPVAVSSAAAGDARREMDEGLALFATRGYEAAAGKFAAAAASAGDQRLDPATARYDRATALLMAGKSLEAAAGFAEALNSSDPGLRKQAHYNRGVALVAAADDAERRNDSGRAVALLDQALGEYESAMRIDPDDEDPKVNHELVSRKRAHLEERIRKRGENAGQREEERQPARERRKEPGQGAQAREQGGPGKEMTPAEARSLLDAMRQRETSQRDRIKPFAGGSVPVEKNW